MKRRYVTTSLSKNDRHAVLRILGFAEFRYLFLEASGDIVLRASECIGNLRSALLEPLSMLDAKAFAEAYPFPILFLQYAGGNRQLPVRGVNESTSLWEEICPFPLSVILNHFYSLDGNPQIEPPATREEFREVFDLFRVMEEKMAETELSVLWFHNKIEEIAIQFHYVRKRRINVGVSPVLAEVTREFQGEGLSAEKLFETFGTNTSFFDVDLSNSNLKEALKTATCSCLQGRVPGGNPRTLASNATI